MAESVEEKIERFIEFNLEMIDAAMSDVNRRHQSIHSKVLLCSIIDSLSKCIFSQVKENGVRFKKVVSECSNWNDCERISLLHLVRAFEVAGDTPPTFDSLKSWSTEEFKKKFHLSNRILSVHSPILRDPSIDVVGALWPKDENGSELKLGAVRMNQLQHSNLLWLYRNSVVHEYRNPGCGFERSSILEDFPYYQQVSNVTAISGELGLEFTNRWELVYPVGFFLKLAKDVLMSVATYFQENGSSPFHAYSHGTYWIPGFNDAES